MNHMLHEVPRVGSDPNHRDERLRSIPPIGNKSILFKRAATEKRFYLILTDIIALGFCVFVAFLIARPQWSGVPMAQKIDIYISMFALPLLSVIAVSEYFGHYSRFKPFWDEFLQFGKMVAAFLALTTVYLFFMKTNFSRAWLGGTWILVLFIVPVSRVMTKHWLMRRGKWFTPTVILGAGPNALESALAIESNILMGFKVVSLLDLNRKDGGVEHKAVHDFLRDKDRDYPVLPFSRETRQQLDDGDSYYLILALEEKDTIRHRRLIEALVAGRKSMSVTPPLRGLPLLGSEVSPIFRHEVLQVRIRSNLANRSSRAIKRLFDIVASLAALLVLLPVFFYFYFSIKRDGGSAFYGQRRVGKDGRLFKCWKFRSMHMDAEKKLKEYLQRDEALRTEWDDSQKLRNDPRVTGIGEFIRKTSIDELPQFWNVLKGDMSLVGPRPVREDELQEYGVRRNYYLMTRPGITGLWQISGRNDVSYNTRINLDSWYVRNWSLWYDLVILLKTPSVLLHKTGAY